MTTAPPDLLDFRAKARAKTGLAADALGIVGDGAHQLTGGYHEGLDVLSMLGRRSSQKGFHPPASAHVNSSTEDYSCRVARDRNALSDYASGFDLGDEWSAAAGGRAAWLRYNNLLYAVMRDHPDWVPALRAINVSLDGATKRRYDQATRNAGLTASSDTVTTHTHHELWRDTVGNRSATLAVLLALIDQAQGHDTTTVGSVTSTGGTTTPEEEDEMFWLVRSPADPTVYLTNMQTYRIVVSDDGPDSDMEIIRRNVPNCHDVHTWSEAQIDSGALGVYIGRPTPVGKAQASTLGTNPT